MRDPDAGLATGIYFKRIELPAKKHRASAERLLDSSDSGTHIQKVNP